jgi:hypothetical protein
MQRMAQHNEGTVLIFARTETKYWHQWLWPYASAMLFLKGRLRFHKPTGERAGTAGAPSVLIAFGQKDAEILRNCKLKGHFVALAQAREALRAIPLSWRKSVVSALVSLGGQAPLTQLYQHVQRPTGNPFWREKVRQQAQQVGQRVAPGVYRLRAG